MGVDALIYVADGDLSPEMAALVRDPRPTYGEDDSEYVYRYTDDGRTWLALNTWQRFYGERYERGDWPTIRRQIDYMRETFRRPVYYHGDFYWYGECPDPITHTELVELDAMWERVGNEPYRAAFRNLGGVS